MIDSCLILDLAAERYEFSSSQAAPLSGGHFSTIYEFPRHGKTFILRVTPPNSEIDISAMRTVLDWMSFLAAHGASVPSPLRSKRGKLIESIQIDNEFYILVAFAKVNGIKAEDLFPGHWSDELTSALGFAVGRMHAISCSYDSLKTRLARPAWDEIGNCFNPPDELDKDHLLVAQKYQEIKLVIQSLQKEPGSYGLIHTDLHFANFLVNPSTPIVTIIDFDDCSYGWYAMDIAMLLLDMTVLYTGSRCEVYTRNFLKHFLLAYLQHHNLDLKWIRSQPDFLKLLEIGLYTMLYRNFNSNDTQSWVGRFMSGRRDLIESDVPFIDLDFFSIADEIAQETRRF